MSAFEIAEELETVNLWRAGAAAKIELNRPDSLNSWDRQMSADLLSVFERIRDDDDVRAVVITGAGRAFCSGADLHDLQARERTVAGHPDLQKSLRERYHPVLTGFRRLDKPVVSAVNGPCVGVGMSLALSADLVYAQPSAYFLLAFVNIGLVPDGGSSALVPARIGFARATELAMLGERLPAAKAADWGLINGVFDAHEFEDRVSAIAARLASGPTRSYAGTKRQLNEWLFSGLDEQLELEAAAQNEVAATGDFVEGVSAFAEKRTATFNGR